MKRPDSDDILIAELWLDHFGSPLPMYGAKDIAIQILEEEGVTVSFLSDGENRQKAKLAIRHSKR